MIHSTSQKNIRPSAGLQRALQAQARLDTPTGEPLGRERSESLHSVIQQYRTRLTLRHIQELNLPNGAKVLEVGCGSGTLGLTLARRGYNVESLDIAHSSGGLGRLLTLEVERAPLPSAPSQQLKLPFPDRTFNLVLAVGVLPNFAAPERPVHELARVLKCGGFAIVSVDNLWHIAGVLDPLSWLRRAGRISKGAPIGFRCRPYRLNRALQSAGLLKLTAETFGYGPFSILGKRISPETLNLDLNKRLQDLAARSCRPLRSLLSFAGAQYLTLARKTI